MYSGNAHEGLDRHNQDEQSPKCPRSLEECKKRMIKQVPHIIDSGKEHEALLEIKAILNKLWLPMKED
jgi:hypothetical protein